jgi:hypothetical protein
MSGARHDKWIYLSALLLGARSESFSSLGEHVQVKLRENKWIHCHSTNQQVVEVEREVPSVGQANRIHLVTLLIRHSRELVVSTEQY